MTLAKIFEYYLSDSNTDLLIDSRRKIIIKELEPYATNNKINNDMVQKCFDMIDKLYFNGTIREQFTIDGWHVDFYVSKKLKTTAGMFRFMPSRKKLDIIVSVPIMDNLFNEGTKKVEIGGVYGTSLCEVFVLVMEHEITHMVLYLLRNHKLNQEVVKSGHTKVFKIIIYNIFHQKRVTHNLLLGDIDKFAESTALAKKTFNLGDSVKCDSRGKVLQGIIVSKKEKNVVLKIYKGVDNFVYKSCFLKDLSMVKSSGKEISLEDIRDKLNIGDELQLALSGKLYTVSVFSKSRNTFKAKDIKTGKVISIYYWVLI